MQGPDHNCRYHSHIMGNEETPKRVTIIDVGPPPQQQPLSPSSQRGKPCIRTSFKFTDEIIYNDPDDDDTAAEEEDDFTSATVGEYLAEKEKDDDDGTASPQSVKTMGSYALERGVNLNNNTDSDTKHHDHDNVAEEEAVITATPSVGQSSGRPAAEPQQRVSFRRLSAPELDTPRGGFDIETYKSVSAHGARASKRKDELDKKHKDLTLRDGPRTAFHQYTKTVE